MFFGNLSSVNSLEFVSMNNQECNVIPEITIIAITLYFTHLVLKQVNAVIVVTISLIPMQEYMFLMLLKI